MPPRLITRRLALILPLAAAACGSEEPPPANFAPLDFSYLTPIRLNVARVDVEQRFVPSGLPPDVSQADPINPVGALKQMAEQRLQAVGAANSAVFSIDNASVIEQDETVSGAFSVTLSIFTGPDARAGFAQATVTRQIAGIGDDLRGALYTLTSQLMNQMNVELEYQVRRSLAPWLVIAAQAPVEQAPLQSGPLTSPGGPPPPPQPLAPTPPPPAAIQPPPAAPPPPSASPPPPHAAPGLPPLGPVVE